MQPALRPKLHFFVCANHREGSPLGPGCGARGEAVYAALKGAVAGDVRGSWVTKTHCLGICPAAGATVARYGEGLAPAILTEVLPTDVRALFPAATAPAAPPTPTPTRTEEAGATRRLVDELHALQAGKVLALARRLRPGLTLEDIRNPHDFPELDDPDWHYADGVLAGIASVRSALAAREKDHGEEATDEGT